jgi:hypothetical protein
MIEPLSLLSLAMAGIIATYWWRSGVFKGRARDLASNHCKHLGLQLLDQSMVITGLWPVRAMDGRLVLRRRYEFEFASLGDRRYRGRLVLVGMRLESIELETYKLPPGG